MHNPILNLFSLPVSTVCHLLRLPILIGTSHGYTAKTKMDIDDLGEPFRISLFDI